MRISYLITLFIVAARELLHALFGVGTCCRFEPVCSHYAKSAFQRFSFGKALWLCAKRLARCHRFGGYGLDPLPEGVKIGI